MASHGSIYLLIFMSKAVTIVESVISQVAKVSTRVIHFRCLVFASHVQTDMDEKVHLDLEDFSTEPFLESFIKEIQKEEAVFLIGIFVALLLVILTVGKKQQQLYMASVKTEKTTETLVVVLLVFILFALAH